MITHAKSWTHLLSPALLIGALMAPHLPAWRAAAQSPPLPSSARVLSEVKGGFDPGTLTPYFTSGDGLAALGKLRDGQFAEAQTLFTQASRGQTGAAREAALFMASVCGAESVTPAAPVAPSAEAAIAHLDRLAAKADYLLADYARFYAARADLARGRYADATRRAARIDPASPLSPPAIFLEADALALLGQLEPAADRYRRYLATRDLSLAPGGEGHRPPPRAHEARHRLALVLERQGKQAEAAALFKRVVVGAPLAGFAAEAQLHLEGLAAYAAGGSALTVSEKAQRGQVLFDFMRNVESEKAFSEVLTDLAAGQATTDSQRSACEVAYGLAQSVYKQRQRARAAPLFDDAAQRCRAALSQQTAEGKGTASSVADLVVKSLYFGGKAASSRGDHKGAMTRFAEIERDFPNHSYADDARLNAADAAGWAGQSDAQIEALLSSLPKKYPQGDMKGEALWRLAWRAYRKGQFPKALAWLDESLKRIPREDVYYAEGQAYYWRGRILDRLGRKPEALASYQSCVRTYPLSYYALSAMMRLREGWPAEANKLAAEVGSAGPLVAGAQPVSAAPARFSDPVIVTPGFRRGVELMRLGLGLRARAEFEAIGLRIARGTTAERLWLLSVLYDRSRQWNLSTQIPKRFLTDFKRAYPVAENAEPWRLSFPQAYADIVVPTAQQNGYPWQLMVAIMREESAFDPLAESYANAIGLTQMIFPTANRFAGGLPVSRETLRDPRTNVAIGGRFLGFLWQHMKQNAGLTVPSYNAGEGATGKWLKQRPGWPLDEFLEAVPYDQTRNYTKRVLSTYGTYHFLYAKAARPLDRFVTWPRQARR